MSSDRPGRGEPDDFSQGPGDFDFGESPRDLERAARAAERAAAREKRTQKKSAKRGRGRKGKDAPTPDATPTPADAATRAGDPTLHRPLPGGGDDDAERDPVLGTGFDSHLDPGFDSAFDADPNPDAGDTAVHPVAPSPTRHPGAANAPRAANTPGAANAPRGSSATRDSGAPSAPGAGGGDEPPAHIGPGRGWRPGGKPPRRPAWQRIAAVLVGAVVLVLVTTYGVRAAHSGKALPGTTVAGVDVGGQTESEIRGVVTGLADPERRLSLDGPDGPIRVSLGGAGLQPDISRTVSEALDARRGSIFGPLMSLVNGENVPLVASIDEAQLTSSIKRIASELNRTPYAGALVIDPQTRAVTTKPSKAGREVRQGELRRDLKIALRNPGRRGELEVPMKTTDAVSDRGVQQVAEDAEAYLRAPLKLTGAGKDFVVSQASLATLLALEPLENGRKARLGVDSDELATLTKRVAASRDRAARSAKISAPASGPSVTGKGEVSWRPKKVAGIKVTAEARTGRAVQVSKLNDAIRKAVRSDDHAIAIPLKTTPAPVTKAAAAKVDSVIGTFTTPYVPGQPRVTNIQRMARSVDDTIIAPGQQFSLNGVTGERTKAKGYVEAPFIADNKIEPSVGGGVSQFSTTMYNAAYFAGLQIDAFRPHSLYIDRYPAGRESTLNFPDIDMKWTNDTSAPVLVRTAYDSAGVTVTLYGNNGGRKVVADPGSREPNPGGDFRITVTRVLTYADGRTVRQPVTTSYANEVKEEDPE